MNDAKWAIETVLEFAEKWAGGSRRDSEAFDEAAPIVRALVVSSAPAQRAEARSEYDLRALHENTLIWRDRAEKAEARIAELERALELAYPFVAEGDEGTEVDGLMHDQIVARINKVMRTAKPGGAGEGTPEP